MRAQTIATLLLLASCAPRAAKPPPNPALPERSLDDVAQAYVKLVLAIGEHDPDYVDAYYGPEEWRAQAKSQRWSLPEIEKRAEDLLREPALFKAAVDGARDKQHSPEELRARYLYRQLESLVAYVDILQGRSMTFDEQSKALYDAVAPHLSQAELDGALAEIDALLPGKEPLWQRYDAFRSRYRIPDDKLDVVFRAAIDGCKAKTTARVALPAGESFTVEYVKDKPWGGYNWYQGSYRSVIQVNTDLPAFIDRAVTLACHEGYPGHHVYNALLEQHLARERRWVEYQVYALYSPQSLIAEGSAEYGTRLAFPSMAERAAFEKEKLFPLAGLDPGQAELFYKVADATKRLRYSVNEAARGRLDEGWDAERTKQFLMRYALASPAKAEAGLRGIDKYKSYLINYNLGEDIVARYVEEVGGPTPEGRWKVFADLLASPRLPSDLEVQRAPK